MALDNDGEGFSSEKKVEEQPAENKPKVKWWQKVRDGVGTAFGEWKFGGR